MGRSRDTAEEVVASLNKGDTSFPVQISTVPFIFDGEIVVAETSVSRIWTGLVNTGFTVTNPIVTSISPVDLTDFVLFRNSWEMEIFFKRNIPEFCYKITIEGIDGELLLLVNRNKTRNYSLMGLKVDAK